VLVEVVLPVVLEDTPVVELGVGVEVEEVELVLPVDSKTYH
jgi:hypothetical protein